MKNKFTLKETSVLMRMSAGIPGKSRKDRQLSAAVKQEHNMGEKSGAWIKNKYPDWALEKIEKLVNEARAYHAAVTLPFDSGIGILPAPLIMEYGDRMRDFAGKFENLINSEFKPKYPQMVEWARKEHNGTFDESDYPDVEKVCEAFYFKTEPLPVPDAGHFSETMKSLLGVSVEQVNFRVADAMEEARKELMKRMIEPVRAMAAKLTEVPDVKPNKKDGTPRTPEEIQAKREAGATFRDTLVQNIKDIVALAPKLNISGDPEIDGFVKDMEKLTAHDADALRASKSIRGRTAEEAMAVLKKLEGYKF